jgi:CubicO group peptidase (beta-lactamase class C family)
MTANAPFFCLNLRSLPSFARSLFLFILGLRRCQTGQGAVLGSCRTVSGRVRAGWCVVLWVVMFSAALAGPIFDEEKLPLLERVLHGYVERGRVPCVVALLDRPGLGEHFYADGARDISTGDPVRRDTIFPIYSITKMMTAVALFQMVEEGKVAVEDPVEKFLPELKNRRVWVGGTAEASQTKPSSVAPTIHHLLTHTAGYYYDTTAEAPLKAVVANPNGHPFLQPKEYLSFVVQIPLHETPGTKYRYSMGYAILGQVIERISGQSLEDYMQARIFRPLGMKDTGFVLPPEKRGRMARICRRDEKGQLYIDPKSEARIPAPGTFYAGGGDLLSTADDLVRFGRMFLGEGQLEGTRILKAETVRRMTSDQLGPLAPSPLSHFFPTPHTYGYGVGLALRDTENRVGKAGAFGWTGNATTLLQIDPKAGLISVVLSQIRPGQGDLYTDFLRAAYDALP